MMVARRLFSSSIRTRLDPPRIVRYHQPTRRVVPRSRLEKSEDLFYVSAARRSERLRSWQCSKARSLSLSLFVARLFGALLHIDARAPVARIPRTCRISQYARIRGGGDLSFDLSTGRSTPFSGRFSVPVSLRTSGVAGARVFPVRNSRVRGGKEESRRSHVLRRIIIGTRR